MAKKGTINYIDRELTQDEFDSIGYPALYILKGNNQIVKFILFDQFGDRLDSNFSLLDESLYPAQKSTSYSVQSDNK